MSRADWEAKAGPAIDKDKYPVPYGRGYQVSFAGDRVQTIDITLNTGVGMEDARAMSKGFLPNDAVFVKSYNNGSRDIDVYTSVSLADRFEPAWWFGDDPGTFVVWYLAASGPVKGIVIGTGDNV